MDKTHLEAAIERGEPFSILMADGKEYHVPHRDYIFLTPKRTVALVMDDEDHVWYLPLLTMTGISYTETPTA